jgi:hypothetical protein
VADDPGTASPMSFDAGDEVSTIRLYVLRVMYLLNFVFLAMNVWPALLRPAEPIGLLPGVAFAFWAALSTLCALGLRYPLKMLPVLFMQLFYKTVWLLAVALPLWSSGQWTAGATGMFKGMVMGAVADLLVIPWSYVFANYVRKPGDPWTLMRRRSRDTIASSPAVGEAVRR